MGREGKNNAARTIKMQLEELQVENTKVGAAGVRELKKALPKLKIVR